MNTKQKEYHKINGKKYVVRKGQKGGKYILINNEKKYLSKKIKGGANINLLITYDKITTEHIPYEYSDDSGLYNNLYKTNIEIIENPESKTYNKTYNIILTPDDPIIEINKDNIDWFNYIPFILNTEDPDKPIANKPFFVDWTLPAHAVVLIIGDIHGDYSSLQKLFNNWIESGYLEKDSNNNYILKPYIYVISLGDIIDYGTNSLNVLYDLVMLRHNNPGRVMLLSGNHEGSAHYEYRITGFDNFISEIANKFNLKEDEYNDTIKQLINYINNIGPDLLSLRFENEKESLYLMHGMYPVRLRNSVQKLSNNITDILIWPEQNKEHDVKVFHKNIHGFEKNIKELWAEATQWNDITSTFVSTKSKRGTLFDLFELGIDILYPLMKKYGIKGFIRGHQDNCPAQLFPVDPYGKTCGNMATIEFKELNKPDTFKCIKNRRTEKEWCKYNTSYEDIPNIKSLEEYLISQNESLKTFNLTRFIESLPSTKKIDQDKKELIAKDMLNTMKNRIITISMAGHKRYAPLGGYIKLTVEEDLYRGGSKNKKVNKNLLKYLPLANIKDKDILKKSKKK